MSDSSFSPPGRSGGQVYPAASQPPEGPPSAPEEGPTRVMSDVERQAVLAAVRSNANAAAASTTAETVRPPPPPAASTTAQTVRPPPPAASVNEEAARLSAPPASVNEGGARRQPLASAKEEATRPSLPPVSVNTGAVRPHFPSEFTNAETLRPPPPAASVTGVSSLQGALARGPAPADPLASGPAPADPLASGSAPADPLVGTTVAGAYLVVRVLGEGGMGRVYEAHHTRIPGKRFALKALHPELAQHATVLARLQREAEAAASLRSPHVVEIYDVNQLSDGRPCLIGEYLEGKDLGELLASTGKLPVSEAVRIVRQVCAGIAAAHANGIVHRDIKPENIFLTGDPAAPTVKILDFGISKTAEGSALTKTGMILGTPAYMAPEQAQGAPIDARADIYAVGAVLYHALTGRRPFERADPTAVLLAVMTEEPPAPRSLNAQIPHGLELVVQRAMAKDPGGRYASVSELDRALSPFGDATTPITQASVVRSSVVLGRPLALSLVLGLPASVASEAHLTRQLVVLFAGLGAGWLGAGLMSCLSGAVRVGRGDVAALSGDSAAVLVIGVAAALLGAGLLAGFYLARHVFQDDARLSALAPRLAVPIALALMAYGTASLLVRLVEAVILQRAIGMAWPIWDVLLFLISLGAALGAAAYQWLEQRS